MFDLYIGDDYFTSDRYSKWDYDLEERYVIERVTRALREMPPTEDSDLVIIIRKAEEE